VFTGKERDAETGLDYFGARYFSGAQGRFTSVDPVFATASLFHPQSWNGYTYGLNNPLKYVDRDGEVPINIITAGVGAAIGGVVGAAGEYVNQVRTSGHITSGARIWTAAGGGALAGGIAGFTLGIGAGAGVTAGAIETGIVTASSTVIGDFTQHRANDALGLTNPGENNTELSDTLVNAATAGIGGSVGGAVADRLLPIPNVRREIQLLQFANRRSTRAARVQAASVRAQSVALGNATIGNTLGSALQQTGNYLWSLFTGTQGQQQQQQPPPKKKKDYETDITIHYLLP
jgi:RHS repeat-associated protein